jgi:hypothetical protein
MSRSIHQTHNRVFYKKSKREVIEMCDSDNPDIDVIELRKKSRIKNETLEQRKTIKLLKNELSRVKNDDGKLDTFVEFIDNLSRSGETEFVYIDKKFSITHTDGKLCFVEQYNDKKLIDKSLICFNDIDEVLDFLIEKVNIKSIVKKMKPLSKCF